MKKVDAQEAPNETRKVHRNAKGFLSRYLESGVEVEIPRIELLRAAMRRIEAQFRYGENKMLPEAALMFAIVNCAVMDTLDRKNRSGAIRYLLEDLRHADIVGVDPQWIRDTLRAMDCFKPVLMKVYKGGGRSSMEWVQ